MSMRKSLGILPRLAASVLALQLAVVAGIAATRADGHLQWLYLAITLAFAGLAGGLIISGALTWTRAIRRQISRLEDAVQSAPTRNTESLEALRVETKERAERNLNALRLREELNEALQINSDQTTKSLETLQTNSDQTTKSLETLQTNSDQTTKSLEALRADVAAEAKNRVTALNALYHQIESLLSLHAVLKPDLPLPALRGWALSPDAAAHLVAHILDYRPRYILEFGSGASTVLMAMALQKTGRGRIVSLDHEPKFLRRTQDLLDRFDQGAHATVVLAPLTQVSAGDQDWTWYDLGSLTLDEEIDLLVVDGPPGAEGTLVRYPALPMVYSSLAPDAVVALDDAKREEESAVLRRWETEFPEFETELVASEKGLAILRRTPRTREPSP